MRGGGSTNLLAQLTRLSPTTASSSVHVRWYNFHTAPIDLSEVVHHGGKHDMNRSMILVLF